MKVVQGNKSPKLDTRNEYEKSIDALKEAIPYAIEEWSYKADFLKSKYDSLIKSGFTEEQALEIVKSRPLIE